jgi:hypothetical protein
MKSVALLIVDKCTYNQARTTTRDARAEAA